MSGSGLGLPREFVSLRGRKTCLASYGWAHQVLVAAGAARADDGVVAVDRDAGRRRGMPARHEDVDGLGGGQAGRADEAQGCGEVDDVGAVFEGVGELRFGPDAIIPDRIDVTGGPADGDKADVGAGVLNEVDDAQSRPGGFKTAAAGGRGDSRRRGGAEEGNLGFLTRDGRLTAEVTHANSSASLGTRRRPAVW